MAETVKMLGDDYVYYVNENGETHKEDGPAVINKDGSTHWYRNGKRHREDGPAVEWNSGSKEWYQNDLLHREDGPAVVWANGTKEWYLNGHKIMDVYNLEDFLDLVKVFRISEVME